MLKALIIENRTYYAAKTFVNAYLAFALYLSFSHIIALFAQWGSHTPWAAPLLIDSMILIGRMTRTPKMVKKARVAGTFLQYLGATLSLTANVLAGDNTGDEVIGVMVVGLFLIVEAVADTYKPTRTLAQMRADAQRVATRKANADAKKAADAKRRATNAARRERERLNKDLAQLENTTAAQAWAADAAAPVSPAPAMDTDIRGYV